MTRTDSSLQAKSCRQTALPALGGGGKRGPPAWLASTPGRPRLVVLVLPWAKQTSRSTEMGLDERAPTPPHPASAGEGEAPQPGHTPPLSDPQHSPSPIKSTRTDPPALCQPPSSSPRPSLLCTRSVTLESRLISAPRLFRSGLGSSQHQGLTVACLGGRLRDGASLLLGVRTPLQRATLQQGACTRGPKQGGCEGSNDEQVPGHCQA